jgi:hypothetical protein
VGGPTGERTVLGVNLDQQVPTCADAGTPGCTTMPLRDVMINNASLVLQPIRAPGGLRPLRPANLRVRRVLEPSLGRVAPLGELLYADTLSAASFAGANPDPVSIDLTVPVTTFVDQGIDVLTFALIAEPEGTQFGYLVFSDRPRMRIVYTIPLRPTFP